MFRLAAEVQVYLHRETIDSVALAPHGVLGWKCGALG